MVVPNNHVNNHWFSYKTWSFWGVKWGYHHSRKHLYAAWTITNLRRMFSPLQGAPRADRYKWSDMGSLYEWPTYKWITDWGYNCCKWSYGPLLITVFLGPPCTLKSNIVLIIWACPLEFHINDQDEWMISPPYKYIKYTYTRYTAYFLSVVWYKYIYIYTTSIFFLYIIYILHMCDIGFSPWWSNRSLTRLKQQFNELDENGDGIITFAELKTGMSGIPNVDTTRKKQNTRRGLEDGRNGRLGVGGVNTVVWWSGLAVLLAVLGVASVFVGWEVTDSHQDLGKIFATRNRRVDTQNDGLVREWYPKSP